jgi:hypothetical protein
MPLVTNSCGEPKKVSYHNALGAQWSRAELTWKRPDGTEIDALENTEFDEADTVSIVAFYSKDFKAAPKKPVSNPYNK